MDKKFTDEEIKKITDHFKAFINNFDNTLKSEVKIEEISYGEEVLVLSFFCEERQYRNYEKDRVGFRGFNIRIWKETPDDYMGSMSTFGWIIPYRHRNKRIITYMSLLKGKIEEFNFKIFDKLKKEIL
mgnify:FL=1